MQRRKTTTHPKGSRSPSTLSAPVATVVRHKCGTSPFDHVWLNVDCCGLFCAGLTYGLHMYGTYVVTVVLLPPWMSYTLEGVRRVSTICELILMWAMLAVD